MMVFSASHTSPKTDLRSVPIETPNSGRKITKRDEFISLKLNDEAKIVLKFLDANNIFGAMDRENQRTSSQQHFIKICSALDESEGLDSSKKRDKAQFQIMKKARYISWDELAPLLYCCDLDDLSSSKPIPKGKIAVDANLCMFNGGYTSCGLCIDTQRSNHDETEESLFDHLMTLSKNDEEMQGYLQGLIVLEKREVDEKNRFWAIEVLTFSDTDRELLGSHSSVRLISPWGHVISSGWWRYDDLHTKANQRGILRCPDPIELKFGEMSRQDQKGPSRIFCGQLQRNSALKMLAKALFLQRYPGQNHYYSVSSRGDEIPGTKEAKIGINCADYALQILQICLPDLSRDRCSVSVNDILALWMMPGDLEKLSLGAKIFTNVLNPLAHLFAGFWIYSIIYKLFNLNEVSSQLKALGGQALVNTPRHFISNLTLVAPESLSLQLEKHTKNMERAVDLNSRAGLRVIKIANLENKMSQ